MNVPVALPEPPIDPEAAKMGRLSMRWIMATLEEPHERTRGAFQLFVRNEEYAGVGSSDLMSYATAFIDRAGEFFDRCLGTVHEADPVTKAKGDLLNDISKKL